MEIRSFLAFELPGPIKNKMSEVSRDIKHFPLDARWVKVDNIHLTVVFLGQIEESNIPQMRESVASVCREYGPFHVSLKNVGIFGSRRNPRVLWMGLDGHIERMSRFRNTLQKVLAPFGVTQERRTFKPHLTLGRFRKGSRSGAQLDEILAKYEGLSSPICQLSELFLFKSDLKPHGAVYTPLHTWPMTGKVKERES